MLRRDLVTAVQRSLVHHGVNIREGVMPVSITKQPNGRLLVKMTDGSEDEFDTVLGAVGNFVDLSD